MRLGRIQNNYSAEGFDMVKQQGLSFVEICCNRDAEAEKLTQATDLVKQEIKRTGIPVAAVGRWNHNVQSNGSLDENNVKLYERLLDTAVFLGAESFVCGINYDDSITLYKNYSNALDFFSRLIKKADGRIKLAVQNCDWNNFVVSPRQWEVILPELPELYIKYDPSHAYNRGADYITEIADYGDRISHFHIKGTVHGGKEHIPDPPAGMDDIKWGSVFATLYARGYNGDLSIEPHSAIWQGELGEKGVLFTKKFIEQFIM